MKFPIDMLQWILYGGFETPGERGAVQAVTTPAIVRHRPRVDPYNLRYLQHTRPQWQSHLLGHQASTDEPVRCKEWIMDQSLSA